jgi:hypothetical protein
LIVVAGADDEAAAVLDVVGAAELLDGVVLLLLPHAVRANAPTASTVATFRPLNKGGLLPSAPAVVPARELVRP